MPEWYKLDGHKVVPCADVMEWARWFETADRHVANDQIGPLRVSTVFLGLDHPSGDGPPFLFETMIFGENAGHEMDESYQDCCSTWEEAEAMHARAVGEAKQRVAAAAALLSPPNVL